ncbi:hypothetical protein TIFTF001_049323 [Ficus carica]|uniref:Uncharacterized protein n=1 Tax=Ficus carica TaxID=3494 RepID=A0AA87Z1Q2_FICCA|nr:hypothetical protein TIFTF001_049323 [Ficus carica]
MLRKACGASQFLAPTHAKAGCLWLGKQGILLDDVIKMMQAR